jgi:organic hydroperoxide reductase OsmC/OhrA
LTYLALCARAGIVVVGYADDAWGKMEPSGRSLKFTEAVLRPRVTISDREKLKKAIELHEEAHESCFIAGSVNFPVRNEATVSVVAGE